jgi:RimJ/RimL family protein N-acetyltransferase
LRGAVVTLRPAVADDVPVLVAIRTTAEVRRWWGEEEDFAAAVADDLPKTFVIEHEGRVVGAIQWYEEDDPMYRHAGIDIYLDPTVAGKGLGTDAVRTLARHLIDDLGHHRLVIDPAAANAAAIRAYEKVGFRTVGVMRRYERGADGTFHDGLLMDLLAEELVRDQTEEHHAMTTSDTPWEPPLAGTEVEHLVGALDRLRATFRWKADDLDEAGLRTRVGTSSLTLGGLLKHLAAAEDYMFTTKLSGEPIGAPWDTLGSDGSNDWEFSSAADDPPQQLYALWDGAVERSRARLGAALARGGLDQLVHASGPDGRQASLRRLVCDLIEEYGRHTGHADLLREAVDGRVGEDPPAGWRPRGAAD